MQKKKAEEGANSRRSLNSIPEDVTDPLWADMDRRIKCSGIGGRSLISDPSLLSSNSSASRAPSVLQSASIREEHDGVDGEIKDDASFGKENELPGATDVIIFDLQSGNIYIAPYASLNGMSFLSSLP